MNKNETYKKTTKELLKSSLILINTFIIYSISILPFIILTIPFYYLLNYLLSLNMIIFLILMPFVIFFELFIFILFLIIISGLIIRIFQIRYDEGEYDYKYENKVAFRWMQLCMLYTPCRKILDIFSVGDLKRTYLRMLGMKIGDNCLVGGVIKDPILTEFGKNVTMGEYAILYGHIHNFEKRKIFLKKVKIGNNCIIGAGAIIMPGVEMEDGSILGSAALATQNQVLKKGKTYGGIPAKEIKNNSTN